MLKRLGNDHVGVCLDTGNSIALLEDPMEVVEALAPRAFTTHFKDMGVEEYRDGFLLAEVPLGTGVLDLPRVVRTLRAARPGDPLQPRDDHPRPAQGPLPDRSLLGDLPRPPGPAPGPRPRLVRAHPPRPPLPRISPLAPEDRLRAEDDNIRRCLAFAKEGLFAG